MDKPKNYDLANIFQFNREVNLYIGVHPPSLSNAYPGLKINGNAIQINRIPFTEKILIAGLWDFNFDANNLEVDSVRIFVNQSDIENKIRGSQGVVNLNLPEWQSSSTIYFTIYWHEK